MGYCARVHGHGVCAVSYRHGRILCTGSLRADTCGIAFFPRVDPADIWQTNQSCVAQRILADVQKTRARNMQPFEYRASPRPASYVDGSGVCIPLRVSLSCATSASAARSQVIPKSCWGVLIRGFTCFFCLVCYDISDGFFYNSYVVTS